MNKEIMKTEKLDSCLRNTDIENGSEYECRRIEKEIITIEQFGPNLRKIVYKDGTKNLCKRIKNTAFPRKPDFISLLLKLKHENILEIFDIKELEFDFEIIIEYADCGSLHTYLHKSSENYTFFKAVNWLMQCAKGLTYLHEMKMLHGDVKSENFLFFNNYQTLKISDFELLRHNCLEHEMEQVERCQPCCDVFSFGTVILEVLSRKKPGDNFERPYHFQTNIWPKDSFIVDHENLAEMETLIKMCFDRVQLRRPKMKVLTTFISGLCEQKLWNKSAGPIGINWNDFKSIKSIGSGKYGKVSEAVWKTKAGDKKIAVKKIRDIYEKKNIEREVMYLSRVDHENIVKFYGTTKDDVGKTIIVMEYADCGSLYNFLHRHLKNNPKIQVTMLGKLNWMLQCSKGVAYLHEQDPKILHCNLKSKNLLLFNGNQTLKICDFGTVRAQKTLMKTGYMAPEVCRYAYDKYTEKCDVYSFGILCWEILSQKEPFYHVKPQESLDMMPPINDVKIDQKTMYLKKLIQWCWNENPQDRPTMNELVVNLSVAPNSFDVKLLPKATLDDYKKKQH